MTIEKRQGKLICRAVNGKVFLNKQDCIRYEANVYYPEVQKAYAASRLKRLGRS